MPPQGTDLVLTANVPHCERYVLVFYSLHIEPCKGIRVALNSDAHT